VTAVPPRVLAVCVDDIGLVDGVAETVVDLAAAERVCAASCVTTAPGWRRAAAVLARAKAPLGVGLHFNLSEGAPLSAELRAHWPVLPGLARLLAAAALRACRSPPSAPSSRPRSTRSPRRSDGAPNSSMATSTSTRCRAFARSWSTRSRPGPRRRRSATPAAYSARAPTSNAA
jgi:hypothetical protein